MLSAIFRGNSVIFTATGLSLLAGGATGSIMMYYWQHEPSNIDYWQSLWAQYRSNFPSTSAPFWQYDTDTSILAMNDNRFLKELTPKLPRLTSHGQVKSIRFFVPLCGASEDLQIINDFVHNKIQTETEEGFDSTQYVLKIIGVDACKDAIQLFMDKIDLTEKETAIDALSKDEYQNEYNFENNDGIYSVDEDIFSKVHVYKHKSFNLINSDIFNASIPRLVLRADAIYDNQALSVLDPARRSGYAQLMKKVASRRCKILLVTERFDEDEIQQHVSSPPPYFPIANKEEVFKIYQKLVNMESRNVKLLQSIPWSAEKLQKFGLPEDYNNAYSDVWLIQCQQ